MIISVGNVNNIMRYNFATGRWTYIKGSSTTGSTGVQGTQGVESASVNPPALSDFVGIYDRANRMYYVMTGYSSGSPAEQDCVFRYNVATNAWTHLNGNFLSTSGSVDSGIRRRGVASGYLHQASRRIYLYGGWVGGSHAAGRFN